MTHSFGEHGSLGWCLRSFIVQRTPVQSFCLSVSIEKLALILMGLPLCATCSFFPAPFNSLCVRCTFSVLIIIWWWGVSLPGEEGRCKTCGLCGTGGSPGWVESLVWVWSCSQEGSCPQVTGAGGVCGLSPVFLSREDTNKKPRTRPGRDNSVLPGILLSKFLFYCWKKTPWPR